MFTRPQTLAAITGALIIATASLTWAFGPGKGFKDRHGGLLMAELLDLSEEQRDEIKSIRKSYGFNKAKKRKDYKRDKMQGLRSLDPSASDYDAQVEALIEKRTEKIATRMRAKAKMHAEIYQVFTVDQREKLAELKSKMRERMQEN